MRGLRIRSRPRRGRRSCCGDLEAAGKHATRNNRHNNACEVPLEHNPEKACPGLDPGWQPAFRKDHAAKKAPWRRSFVAVGQHEKDQHAENDHREAEGGLLAVPAPRLPHGEIFPGNDQKAEEPNAETDRQTGDCPNFRAIEGVRGVAKPSDERNRAGGQQQTGKALGRDDRGVGRSPKLGLVMARSRSVLSGNVVSMLSTCCTNW